MAKKKDKKTKSNNGGGGISSKTMLLGGAVLLGLFAMSSNSSETNTNGGGGDPCAAYYNVNGNRVCETLLPDMGYIYCKGLNAGDGWYAYSQFPAQYGMAPASWEQFLRNAAQNSLDPSNPQYVQSKNLLQNAYRGTTGPLQKM